MELGIGSYALAWSIGVPGYPISNPLSVLDFLDLAHQYQVKVVQLADNFPLYSFSEKELSEVKEKALQFDLKLEVGARGLTESNLTKYLEIATYLQSDILRMVIDQKDYEPAIPEVIAQIKNAIPDFSQRNIQLALENHDRLSSRQFIDIIEGVASDQVGICLDTVNSFGKAQGVDEVMKDLLPYTINLHIKDFIIRRQSHNMGFEILGSPAGEGMLPLKELIDHLDAIGKCNSGILELWPNPESTVEATIKKELIWLDLSLENLKQLIY